MTNFASNFPIQYISSPHITLKRRAANNLNFFISRFYISKIIHCIDHSKIYDLIFQSIFLSFPGHKMRRRCSVINIISLCLLYFITIKCHIVFGSQVSIMFSSVLHFFVEQLSQGKSYNKYCRFCTFTYISENFIAKFHPGQKLLTNFAFLSFRKKIVVCC